MLAVRQRTHELAKKKKNSTMSSKGMEERKPLFCLSMVTVNSWFVVILLIYKW